MTMLKRAVAGTVAMGMPFIPGIAAANDKHRTDTSATFEEVKARCVKAIADRQAKVDRLTTRVAQNADPHDADLNAIITTSKSGLIVLQAVIEANTADLAAAIAAANTAGDPDAAEAAELSTKLEAKLASATTKIDGIDVAGLLAITPAGYNTDKKVLHPYLQSVRSARSDVKKASQLARHIARLLEPGDDTDEHEA